MATHIALLRGINVGGRNKVAMADLREVVSGLGHVGVVTYIQSGNVVFTSGTGPGGENGALADALERAIAAALGVQPAVIVLSRDDLARVVRDNPYADEPNPKLVHAVFFRDPSVLGEGAAAERGGGTSRAGAGQAERGRARSGGGREARGRDKQSAGAGKAERGGGTSRAAAAIEEGERRSAERGGRDTAQMVDGTLFVHTPDGFGRSELALYLLGRAASPFAVGTARNWSTVTKLLALCEA